MKKIRSILLMLMMLMTSVQSFALSYVKYIKVGESFTLRPNITSYGRSYSWSFSGGQSSCVSCSGMYSGSTSVSGRGVKAGWVIILCEGYSKDGKTYYYDLWEITVEDDKPTSVTLSPSKVELDVGATTSIRANVSPAGAQYSSISWSSNNTGVASISGSGTSGTIKGVSPGEATISATTDNNVTGRCNVKVWGVSPTAVTISGESAVYIGYTIQLTASFTPSTHHSNITWSSDKTSVATVSQNGVVTGAGSGTATIKVTTANGISTTKTITVTEPPFTLSSTSPNNNATGVTVFQQPSATYSLALYSGTKASEIKLYAGSVSDKVDGKVNISDKTVTFVPTKALKPFTKYTFLIPANAVKNQWGTGYSKDVSFSFTTGDVSPMTLTASMAAGYVEEGDLLELKASENDAKIYYTLDGSEPTEQSTLYTAPIVIDKEKNVWAKAYKNGYATPEFKGTYKISHVHVIEKYPFAQQLYKYKDVNPYVLYEVNISEGPQFSSLSVIKDGKTVIKGQFIVYGKRLVFVPAKELEMGHSYTVTVPEGAVQASDGEPNKAMQWRFTSGDYIRSISAGYQQAAAVQTDNTLLYWGQKITAHNGGDNINAAKWSKPRQIASDVSVASCGYTHNLFTKTGGQVWGWGLQFCGEVGNNSYSLVVDPVQVYGVEGQQVSAGPQTSAVLKNGALWMAGRNDFGQVGNISSMAYSNYQSVETLSDVKQVAQGWQTVYALQDNGSLYGWGYNGNGLIGENTKKDSFTPVQIMTGVDTCAISKWDNSNVAAVKTDGSLWTWGLNEAGQIGDGTTHLTKEPVKVMDNVNIVAIGQRFMAAIDTEGALWTWGDNSYGQLGDGSTNSVAQPHKIMDEVESIELGPNYAVALKVDGSVWTWGANDLSQLGDGTNTSYRATPQQIIAGRERKAPQGVQISETAIDMCIGDVCVICAKPNPLQADYQEWTWSTTDASVATVDGRGVVTAISKGTADIILSSDNGKTAKCTITVDDFVEGIHQMVKLPEVFDVYDLHGYKVRTKVSTIKGLPKGVYVINGRKVLVK